MRTVLHRIKHSTTPTNAADRIGCRYLRELARDLLTVSVQDHTPPAGSTAVVTAHYRHCLPWEWLTYHRLHLRTLTAFSYRLRYSTASLHLPLQVPCYAPFHHITGAACWDTTTVLHLYRAWLPLLLGCCVSLCYYLLTTLPLPASTACTSGRRRAVAPLHCLPVPTYSPFLPSAVLARGLPPHLPPRHFTLFTTTICVSTTCSPTCRRRTHGTPLPRLPHYLPATTTAPSFLLRDESQLRRIPPHTTALTTLCLHTVPHGLLLLCSACFFLAVHGSALPAAGSRSPLRSTKKGSKVRRTWMRAFSRKTVHCLCAVVRHCTTGYHYHTPHRLNTALLTWTISHGHFVD